MAESDAQARGAASGRTLRELSHMDGWAEARERMVAEQIAARRIQDARVLEAMRSVPRHLFVPPAQQALAYADRAVPIGEGQTISQPYMVAAMTEALALGAGAHVLEIGTGSGYQAAILSRIAADVITIERWPSLADAAGRLLASLGYSNVRVITGDGTRGFERAPPTTESWSPPARRAFRTR